MKRLAAVLLGFAIAACGPSPRANTGIDAAPGAGSDSGGGGGDGGSGDTTTAVYAQTASTLYRVDPDSLAITMVAPFGWPVTVLSDSMTDIAIDSHGNMIGVSATRVYSVDVSTAKATLLSSGLQGDFNGLSFVPAAMLGRTGDDVLVGSRNQDGAMFEVDPMTGHTSQVGNMGSGFNSSGDLVAVEGFGTVLTASGTSSDRLVTLAPNTFAATAVGSSIGYSNIFGVAFWKGKVFGFTSGGDFILINPTTGVGTLVAHNSEAWWGAAVTTVAPIIE